MGGYGQWLGPFPRHEARNSDRQRGTPIQLYWFGTRDPGWNSLRYVQRRRTGADSEWGCHRLNREGWSSRKLRQRNDREQGRKPLVWKLGRPGKVQRWQIQTILRGRAVIEILHIRDWGRR